MSRVLVRGDTVSSAQMITANTDDAHAKADVLAIRSYVQHFFMCAGLGCEPVQQDSALIIRHTPGSVNLKKPKLRFGIPVDAHAMSCVHAWILENPA